MSNEIENELDFQIFRLNYEKEIQLFSKRNQELIKFLPKLGEAVNDVFKQITPVGKLNMTVYMLGRVCIRHYEALVLLCINGFGFRAMSVLRSLFENCVDSFYLRKNPNKLDDFIHYGLLQLHRSGFEAEAEKREPKYLEKIDKFKKPDGTWRTSWCKTNIKKRAESVGADQFIIKLAYIETNQFVHSSISELEDSIILNSEGVFVPVESDNQQDRRVADLAFKLASSITIEVLKNQIDCFDLSKCQHLDEYENEINNYYESRNQ